MVPKPFKRWWFGLFNFGPTTLKLPKHLQFWLSNSVKFLMKTYNWPSHDPLENNKTPSHTHTHTHTHIYNFFFSLDHHQLNLSHPPSHPPNRIPPFFSFEKFSKRSDWQLFSIGLEKVQSHVEHGIIERAHSAILGPRLQWDCHQGKLWAIGIWFLVLICWIKILPLL